MRPSARLSIAIGCLCLFTALPACKMEERVVGEAWWHKLPADEPGGGSGKDARSAGGLWAIPLKRFEGSARHEQARDWIAELQREAGVRDLWSEDVDRTLTVYRGRFTDPSTEQARIALHRTRRIRLDGEQPFADVRLTSLAGAGQERITDPHDLRQYPGYYTLQVGYYDTTYDGDHRDAAEKAAADLREQGHDAYYYHGPHRSLVTVGLFMYEEAFVTADDPLASNDAQVDAYSPTVRNLQEEFPYNRVNGRRAVQEPGVPEEQQTQDSFIVRVF